MVGIIQRLKFTLPFYTLRTLYNAFILPHLNYGAIVWAGGYRTPLLPINLLQKAVRIIAGTHFLASSSNLFCDLKLLTLTDLYSLQLGVFIYRHHNHSLPIAFNNYFVSTAMVHSHNTKGRSNLCIP